MEGWFKLESFATIKLAHCLRCATVAAIPMTIRPAMPGDLLFLTHMSDIAPTGASKSHKMDRYLNRWAVRSMRYFFHLQNGRRISDTEGNEFSDDNAAMVEAAIVAKGLGRHRSDAAVWRLVVTKLAGEWVGEVVLSTGLPLAP